MVKISAIIVAAGNSTRMGGINKQLIEICGKPVIVHTITAFNSAKNISEIIVVTKQELIGQIQDLLKTISLDKPIKFVCGGDSRQVSVTNGINACNENADYFAIHDGARPLVLPDTIDKLCEYVMKYGCVAPCTELSDTVKKVNEQMCIINTPDRSSLRAVQTPQIMKKDFCLDALSKVTDTKLFTDDCGMLESAGYEVRLFNLQNDNIKITHSDDISRAELIFEKRTNMCNQMRIGHGYDVHKLDENRKLILGGMEIPYEKGLLGHSDADVLTHAVMDALLGAAAMGDIGGLFPDTDPAYKDADSMLLLKKVCNKIADKGYKIINIDCTLIAQAPKLKPYIEQIRKNYADVMNVNISQINVKATTEEKLGFTGRKEGMSAHCVCLIKN
ncbi:MAG: 2-C-methyl-D-erythritol 2,4-cyclodiphosphate synthase [Clostridia bacterium]|nr:2-C-methyl-D-erythritol 2,4-cyclodiphosphate synthase [Clostridia bacterium]